jgi:two-component system, LytTR family, sensor kinase
LPAQGIVASLDPPSRPEGAQRRAWVGYALAWLPPYALYASGIAAAGGAPGMAFRGALASVLPWALGGLLVLRVVRRLQWPEQGRARVLLQHVALAVAFIALTTTATFVLMVADERIIRGVVTIRRFDPRVLPWQALNATLVYGALVGVAYARQSRERVQEQAARAARAELLKTTAELAALRSQLNPHFILNTLHTLLGLVRREPALAEQAIERIGDLLRYGLRLQREAIDEVTLQEEWDFVRSYLELEALRLGDRLRLEMDADQDAMECLVTAFVLQPLVENAIRHGIAPRAGGGRLAVRARRAGGTLRLEVADDGGGATPEALRGGPGLGLRLLRERLQVLYGESARLRLVDGAPGLRAELELPVRPALVRESA